ncbi:carboxypeptidase-like regulatory domain-containing protein [Fimbriiglobus ruber]|uniref:Copper binding protein, plastocyanin/azurin family n=1 Tax=Fimbriiglobus ruber TaxID=1908690 RepID=A0A225DR49_9BACT|nr:carboxypeptidase-like regulatory domain-containing protein [Fimbriiglobus ruber]OWK43872.1 Copper binding protein, plastocyanin/azurin family [Fimbriiglobus ruber]
MPFVLTVVAGCGPSGGSAPNSTPQPPTPLATKYNPATAGTIQGQVRWQGVIPKTAPDLAPVPTTTSFEWQEKSNPYEPRVDGETHGLADAVVYLAGVDPAASKPWDWPDVRIELRDFRIDVRQGHGDARRVGVVRRGAEVEIVSEDSAYHMLRARGAAFFTLPFPEPNKPLTRRLDNAGLVELTSGAGYFWTAADLFVSEHPYYAITDATGRYTLAGVPPGTYDLVCWVRDWNVTGKDRDPETGLVFRQHYAAPYEQRVRVTVPDGETNFTINATRFHSPR